MAFLGGAGRNKRRGQLFMKTTAPTRYPGQAMAYDGAFFVDTRVLERPQARPLAQPRARPLAPLTRPRTVSQPSPSCFAAPFRAHEAVALTLGGLAIGVMGGALMFFGVGREIAWVSLTAAVAGYIYVLHLVGLSCRDVFATRAPASTALFGIHLGALLLWPITLLLWTPSSWQMWLGLPLALVAGTLFLLIARAPARAMHRSGAHLGVIAAVGVYQCLWSMMNLPA
jgi:hypothetical protein